MRRFFLLSIALALIIPSAACVVAVREPVRVPAPRQAPLPPIDPTVGYFYDALDPLGDWIWSDPWGWVWTPRSVPGSWSPYHDGRWIWTVDGWYWLSEEPWAWATYHYGRWAWVPRWGWVWVPGETWAPAWVAWRWGGGWAGWAPLPPEVVWTGGRLSWNGDIDAWIDVDWWCFVQEIHVVEPRVYRYAVPVGRNVTLLRTTKDRTRYLRERDRVVNRGVEIDEVRRAIRRDVPTWRITDVSSPRDAGRTVEARREVQVWRPRLEPPPKDARPGKPVTGTISREDTERGARRRAVPAAPRRETEAEAPPPAPPASRRPAEPPRPPEAPGRPGRVERPRAVESDLAAERERLAREQAAERDRLASQQAEEARRAQQEQERKVRADREAADARMRAERAEQERLDRERAAEARRAADEEQRRAIEARAAQERRVREAAAEKEQADRQRAEEARRVRAEAERKALEARQAEERRVQRERAEQEQRVLEERARRDAERAERAKPKNEESEEKKKEKKDESPPDRKRTPR